MKLATVYGLLAALAAPADQSAVDVAVDVAVWPGAVKPGETAFDSAKLNRALVRELQRRGFVVGTSAGSPRIAVEVAVIAMDNPLGLEQHATIAAIVHVPVPGRQGQQDMGSETQAASCSASAHFGLDRSNTKRTQAALNRCIEQLAAEITANFVRRRQMVIVR